MTKRIVQAAIFALVVAWTACAALAADSQITVGNARFTIITPNLVRLEYANGGAFTDDPTLFAGNRSARFDGASIHQDAGELSIDTGEIALTYKPDGKPFGADNLTAVIRRGDATARWSPGTADPLNLGGTLRTLDQIDGPVDMGQGLISRSGWAVVDDSGTPVLTQDWAKSRPNKQETDWYLFGYGLDFKAALKSLAAISGPVPLPRKNLLGTWYSRYWPYTSTEFRQIVKEYSDHGFPLDNIVMDMDWHVTHYPGVAKEAWTGYTWNRSLLPDAEELLKWFHQQGLFVTLNDHPADGVAPQEHAYPAFMRAMGVDPSSGQTLPFDAGSKKYLDAFFEFTHLPLEKEGVDFWWLDWQQFPFTRSVPDLPNLAWLNHFNFLRTSRDDKRGVSFSRWGGWGDQVNPIHFSGDAGTDWQMLAFEVPFTSTSGNVGCFFWTHDIGGHRGGRNEESYTRWCQFGALSASLRSHSTRNATMDRRPWKYSKWAEDSMRVSFQLRSQLFPYIYSSAAETCADTVPLLRPMYFEHPELESAYHNAQEYYFGDDLLVAPIAMPGAGPTRVGWQRVWFPPGTGPWFNYFTGELFDGGAEGIVASDINQFPLFFRGGVPIPMRPYTPRPATAALDHLVVRCYPGNDGQTGSHTLYEDDGQTQAYRSGAFAKTELSYRRDGGQMAVSIAPTSGHFDGQVTNRSFTIEFPCVEKPTSATIDGAACESEYDPSTSTARIEIANQPIDKAIQVVVDTNVVDPQFIRQRATAAMMSGIVGRTIEPKPIKEMVAEALDASKNAPAMTAVLGSAGVAALLTNDAPYLYKGHETYRVYAARGVLDSEDATASLTSANIPGFVTPSVPIKVTDGSSIDLAPLCNLLPPEDMLVLHGKSPRLRIALNVGGKSRVISYPVHATAPNGSDLALRATAAATSFVGGSPPAGAIDGVVDGYPSDSSKEWASNHEREGAAITLTWKTDQTFSHVALYDRPTPNDQVQAGRLVFSNGATVPFGELPDDGMTPENITFPAKTVRWMRVEITKVSPSTTYAGLAEIVVTK
jgi:alpha-glucosidase (family GH31 glycosyl hydrolase)